MDAPPPPCSPEPGAASSEPAREAYCNAVSAAMEAAGDGFVVVDPAGRVARLNGAAERLTGYSGAEASGRLLSEIVPLLDPTTGRPVIGAMWDAVLSSADGLPCSLVALLSDRKGSERSVAATAVPIRSVTTHVVSGAVLILRDRTEYLNQERHRREQDEDFAAVLEASPEAIGVINTVSGKFEKLNHQAEVVLKRSREELLRLGPAEVSPATQPDGRASREVAKEHIAEALRGGRPVFEWAHLDGRGNTVLCEVRLVALPPPRHHLVRFSVTDITDRKRQEAEARRLQENLEQRVAERTAELAESAARLRESLRLLESVVEHAPTRVFWKDAQSRYLGCNSLFAADAGCRSPAEVIGKTDFELTWKDQAELYRADDRAVIDTGAFKLGYEEPQTTPDGRRLWLRTSKVPLHDEKGVIVGVLGIYEDITEHKELEAQFRQAQKLEAIGQLAGGVAHDFNNILAANLMTLGLMRMNPDLDPETRQSLDDLETHTRHAANLTNQLLMFSRRSVLTLRPIDANQVVARLLKMLERLIGEHIELRFDDRGAALMVEADSGMLEQVLINLAVNARDAMPKGGTIVVRTEAIHFPDAAPRPLPPRRPGAFVCLSMSDTGCGMDDDTRKRIFEPFFTTKDVGKGTGLGLATVHGIVAQHNGWVEVDSTLGRGTTFRIFLPAHVPEAPLSNAAARDLAPPRGKGEHILLVEDAPRVRLATARTLRLLGYRVLEAANGAEARELWDAHSGDVDVLLTDVVMPAGTNGLDLAEELQSRKPELRVVISSGYSSDFVRAPSPARPRTTYLPKPYAAKTLATALRALLDDNR